MLTGWDPESAAAGTWLVFAERPELREGVATRLEALCPGAEAVGVRPGEGFGAAEGRAYTVDPSRPEDLDRLCESLRRSGRHLRGAVLAEETVFGWRSWRALIRAWSRCFLNGPGALSGPLPGHLPGPLPGHLVTASAGAHEVVGGDAVLPCGMRLSGLARILPREEPALCQTTVDFAPGAAAEEVAARLAEEAVAGAFGRGDGRSSRGETVVAYRGRHRWLPGFEPLPLPVQEIPLPGRGGHYLLLGGLGRFARAAAAHLARQGPVRLTLIDTRTERDLSAGCRADLRALAAALTAAGHEVAVLQGDVTDAGELSERIDRAVARFGEIHGVVHAARVSGPPLALAELTEEDLAARLAPALLGLPALQAALAGHRPAFCAVVSGLAAVLGTAGRGAEALADGYREAFVQAAGAPWRSFSHEGGGDAAAALARFLRLDGVAHAVAAAGNPEMRRAGRRRPVDPRTPPAPVDSRPPRDEREARVAAVWREVLGLDHLGIDDDFFLLGGHSLAGLRILSRLREELGVELPLAALFEARTVEGLARRLGGEPGEPGIGDLALARLLDRVESLSAEDLDALLAGEVAR